MLRYIKIVDNKPINYTLEQLFQDHPGAKIYDRSKMPSELLLKNYGVYPLITTPKPEGNLVEEGDPIFDGSEWVQTWTVKEHDEDNLEYQQEKQLNSDPNIFRPFLENKELFVDDEIRKYRYDICKSCEKFINLTKQCKECGCFMTLKTKLKISSCPLDKWSSQADK